MKKNKKMIRKTILFYFLSIIFLFNSPIIYASFPVGNKIYSDASSHLKKETVEEYKIRMKKQLYGYDGEKVKTEKLTTEQKIINSLLVLVTIVGIFLLWEIRSFNKSGGVLGAIIDASG